MPSSEKSFTAAPSFDSSGTRVSLADKYISFDRKILKFLRQAEKLMFSATYAMVQENSFRIKYSLIGLFIDFLQIFAFTLSSDFGFNEGFDNLASTVLAPVQLISWNVFQALFWVSVIICLSAFGVATYVGYTFAVSDFSYLWPLKYLRTIVNAILSILFIPILTILLIPLKLDAESGILTHFQAEGIVGWGDQVITSAVVGIICVSILVPFSLLLGLLNFEYSLNTNDVVARHTSWLDFIYLVLKTALVFFTNFLPVTPSTVSFRSISLLIITSFVTLYTIIIAPYYKRWMNSLRALLFGGLFGASVSTVLRVFVPSLGELDVGSMFGIHVGLTIVFGLIFGASVCIRQRIADKGVSDLVYRSVNATNPNTTMAVHRKGGIWRLWWHLSAFYRTSKLMISLRSLEKSANKSSPYSEEVNELAGTLFQKEVSRSSPPALILLAHANFLICTRRDWVGASAQVRKVFATRPGFYSRWLCYVLEQKIDRVKRSSRLGSMTGSTDLMKFVEFQHTFTKARRFHLQGLRSVRQFWTSLLEDEGEKQLGKISKAQVEMTKSQYRALMAYSRLIAVFPNNMALWRSYGSFLSDVAAEKEEAQLAFTVADELEEKSAKKTSLNTRKIMNQKMEKERTGLGDEGDTVAGETLGENTMKNNAESEYAPTEVTDYKSKTSSASGRRLMSSLEEHSTTQRLHRRFVQALLVLLLLFVFNFGMDKILIGIEDSNLQAAQNIVIARTAAMVGLVGVEEIAINYYSKISNGTSLGMDKVDANSWTMIPNGVDAHLAAVESQFATLDTIASSLFGSSGSMGIAVENAWRGTVNLMTFDSEGNRNEEQSFSYKDAIDTFRRSSLSVAREAAEEHHSAEEVLNSADFSFALVNGLESLGGLFSTLSTGYLATLDQINVLLQGLLFGMIGFAFLLIIVLVLSSLRPTLNEAHFDDHLAHSLLTYVPPTGVQEIVKKVEQCEIDLTKELLDMTNDEQDQFETSKSSEHILETAIKRYSKSRKDDQISVEVDLYIAAKRHSEKCKGMRWLHQLYFIGFVILLAILAAQSLLIVSVLKTDLTASHSLVYSGIRLEAGTIAFATTYILPETLDKSMGFGVKLDCAIGEHMEEKLEEMVDAHNLITYGDTTKVGMYEAYQYVQDNQAELLKNTIAPRMDIWLGAFEFLHHGNLSLLDYSNEGYEVLHENWNQPGYLKLGLEQANQQYYQGMLTSHASIDRDNVHWLIVEVVALLLVYVVIVRRILSERKIQNESVDRLMRMLPSSVLSDVPLIAEYIKDKQGFLTKVKEAGKTSTRKNIDERWAEKVCHSAPEAYLIITDGLVIADGNRRAQSLFKADKKVLCKTKIETLIAPSYLALAMGVIRDFSKARLSTMQEKTVKIMIQTWRERETVAVSMSVRNVSLAYGKGVVLKFVLAKEETGNQSNQKDNSLFKNIPCASISVSGKILKLNVLGRNLLGISPQKKLISTKFEALFDKESRDEISDLIHESIGARGAHVSRNLTVEAESGQQRVLKVTMWATETEHTDEIRYLSVMFEDLSEFLAMQDMIDFHASIHNMFLSEWPHGVLIANSKGKITLMNENCAKLFGISPLAATTRQLSSLINEGMPLSTEWKRVTAIRSDGNGLELEVKSKEVVSHQGKGTMVLVFLREAGLVEEQEVVNPVVVSLDSPSI